ncbi:unnamed protein product [Rotaria sp. Silwood1]|nr:unnamed protein product [Rotaria sp. Silwood1]CAF3385244.1 unnamed protein product [Rotaria sp. Silwood1]CAF3407374.1 unnamed protein product [Rotaria sp. Silwood1]CAF3413536.1 unnamed protein product [Rotaria sp. Silwood1]CAF4539540.1 unnamed protein product [Rotaria sp. Silwood1]
MGKGRIDGIATSQSSTRWYYFLLTVSQVIGISALIVLGVLFGKYRGGFGWSSDLTKVFNNHPLFMALGMIFFYGDAILVYRVFRDTKKIFVKIIHACLLALSLILSSIGLKGVFDSHNRAVPPRDNLVTAHSWIGLTVVILFGLQWVCGFITYLFPKLSESIRQAYMPSHKFWGKTIFILAIVAFMMGVVEYSIFDNLYNDKKLRVHGNTLTVMSIMFLIFAIIVIYLVGDNDFQRPPENVDEHTPLTE